MTDEDTNLTILLNLSDDLSGGDSRWREFSAWLYRRATARVGPQRGAEYVRARLLRTESHDPALADLHREIFGDLSDAPFAWRSAYIERDHARYVAGIERVNRRSEERTALRERKRRERARR